MEDKDLYLLGIVVNLHTISTVYSTLSGVDDVNKSRKKFLEDICSKTNILTEMWANSSFSNISMFEFTDHLKDIENNAISVAMGLEDKADYKIKCDPTKRLVHILSGVTLLKPKSEKCFMPLKEFHSENIFPDKEKYTKDECIEFYKTIYKKLVDGIVLVLENSKNDESLLMTTSALDSVFFKYTTNIPAFYTGESDDVSLYEFAKVTSAFSVVMYKQYMDNIYDNQKNFAIIRGDFFSIQSFIFNEGTVSKNPANSLRGKSFYVSLMSDLAAIYVLEKLELPYFNIMMNAAGQFVLLSYNNDKTEKLMDEVRDSIENWLYNKYFASVSFGLSVLQCSVDDFHSDKFNTLFLKLLEEKERSKATRFNLHKSNSYTFELQEDYYHYKNSKCSICGVKTALSSQEVCESCNEYITLGKNLRDREKSNLYICKSNDKTSIFGRYNYYFDNSKQSSAFMRMHIDLEQPVSDKYNYCDVIHYKSYVAVDNNDDGEEIIRSFDKIASYGLDETYSDMRIISVLKADVDNLGLIFSCGISEKNSQGIVKKGRLTFSRINMLSRLIHSFFSYYLYSYMKEKSANIYTVFSGGDDLFLVGRYDSIIDIMENINTEFSKIINYNEEITISSGIGFYDCNMPIWFMAEDTEHKLESAKKYKKDILPADSISIYKGNISILYGEYSNKDFFHEFHIFQEKINEFENYINISVGFLYKILVYCDMQIEYTEQLANKDKNINLKNILWRSHLYYLLARIRKPNIRDNNMDSVVKYFTSLIDNNPKLLKTLIALRLYDHRSRNKETEV